jgi:hypothetical protein
MIRKKEIVKNRINNKYLYYLEKAAFPLSTFYSLPHYVTHYLYNEIEGGKKLRFH